MDNYKRTLGKIALSLVDAFEKIESNYSDKQDIYPTSALGISKLEDAGYDISPEIDKSYGDLVLVSENFVSKTIQLVSFLDIPAKAIYLNTQLPYRLVNEWYTQLFKYDSDSIYVIDNEVYYLWHNDVFSKIYEFTIMVIRELRAFIEPFKKDITERETDEEHV